MEREELQKIIDDALSEYCELVREANENDHEANKRIRLLNNYTTYLEQKLFKQN